MGNSISEPWIGLIHLRPVRQPNLLGEHRKGAYVNAVALASGAGQFHDRVEEALQAYGLGIVETSDVDRVSAYRAEGRIGAEIDELIRTLSDDEPVKFDVFDAYAEDDS